MQRRNILNVVKFNVLNMSKLGVRNSFDKVEI